MAKKWIQQAIKKPGALTATAKRTKGGMTRKGTISKAFLAKAKKKKGTLGKRARLAITLRKFK